MTRKRQHRILMLLENNCFPHDTRVLLQARSLRDVGFAVTVISPTGASKRFSEDIEGITAYRYPAPFEAGGVLGYLLEYGYSLVMAYLYCWFVFFRRGFDAIHVHSPPDVNALVPMFFKLLGKRFVYDMHDLSPELFQVQRGDRKAGVLLRGLYFFERLACRWADRSIATNATQQGIQITRGGADKHRCYIVRNGPNSLFLRPTEPAELQLESEIVIGYVGLMGYQDGVDSLVQAIGFLASEHRRNDFHCVFIGGGPALESLKVLANDLGVADRVSFAGMVDFQQVPKYISAFDICVTPDPSNPYNDSCTTIKTMEYMALRKPTVCFETHENRVTAGDSAAYALNNDCRQLAQQIAGLMDNPEKRKAMGDLGRERIENGLTWDDQASVLVAMYPGLLGNEASRDAIL